MTTKEQLRKLWLNISEVSLPIAALRDQYAQGALLNTRFSQIDSVYRNLNEIEQGLFDFLESKKPMLGKKPYREFLMIARSAVENAEILLNIANDELEASRAKAISSSVSNPADAPMSAERFEELADLADQMRNAGSEMSRRLAPDKSRKR